MRHPGEFEEHIKDEGMMHKAQAAGASCLVPASICTTLMPATTPTPDAHLPRSLTAVIHKACRKAARRSPWYIKPWRLQQRICSGSRPASRALSAAAHPNPRSTGIDPTEHCEQLEWGGSLQRREGVEQEQFVRPEWTPRGLCSALGILEESSEESTNFSSCCLCIRYVGSCPPLC